MCVCVCVLLVGFSDLLILFLGLQNFWDLLDFFVQISLLDLGIHLDGKKIAKKML